MSTVKRDYPCGRQRRKGATTCVAGRRRRGPARHLALAAPATPPDVIFVTTRPPYRQLCGSAVSDIAKRALRRAGVTTVPRPGAHTFRHALAPRMLRGDVSMKAVADLLGHARLETTAIYAKLDRETLATIALPWPGGAR